ncbi:transmembrane protein 70, mitochondrial [Microcaecilia unicolor]|uniref:Transmembrane protein 70, mitochondrial n=1 Tax=Microcaecilia unicolor TaxID=1415580 RepID=A0A6P7X0L3_9AMPH|nr:transmembrane protein 70, mitochondrial [Microcaecilia unicolor]
MLLSVLGSCRFLSLGFLVRSSRGGGIAGTAPPVLSGWRTFSRCNKAAVLNRACDLSTPELRLARGYETSTSETRNKKTVPYVKYVHYFSTSSSGNAGDGRLIYTGNLAKAVLGVKFFSYSTSMFNLCVMPHIVFKSGIGVDSLTLQIAFCSIIGFFTFVTPVILHLFTKGYVVRLYHKAETDTYTAITYSVLLTEKRTVFHQKDVKVPEVNKMLTTFYAQTKSMLVNPMMFSNPVDYNHLMGYDKPFTFDLEELKEPTERKVPQQ